MSKRRKKLREHEKVVRAKKSIKNKIKKDKARARKEINIANSASQSF